MASSSEQEGFFEEHRISLPPMVRGTIDFLLTSNKPSLCIDYLQGEQQKSDGDLNFAKYELQRGMKHFAHLLFGGGFVIDKRLQHVAFVLPHKPNPSINLSDPALRPAHGRKGKDYLETWLSPLALLRVVKRDGGYHFADTKYSEYQSFFWKGFQKYMLQLHPHFPFEPFMADIAKRNDLQNAKAKSLKEEHGHQEPEISVKNEGVDFDCLEYIFGKNKDMASAVARFVLKSDERIDHACAGDIVMYLDEFGGLNHVGRIIENKGEKPRVKSKPGWLYPLLEHNLEEVCPSYGYNLRFYTPG